MQLIIYDINNVAQAICNRVIRYITYEFSLIAHHLEIPCFEMSMNSQKEYFILRESLVSSKKQICLLSTIVIIMRLHAYV